MLNRRTMLKASLAGMTAAVINRAQAGDHHKLPFTLDLRCGAIGVRADQREAIELAHKHGFQSVTPRADYLAKLSSGQMEELQGLLKQRKLSWGAAGLSVQFRNDTAEFERGLRQLPREAQALKAAGVTRVGTYILSWHDELSYLANFKQHAHRLGECAKVLADSGLRLGFEYLGPKTLWASGRHTFIHSLEETKELNSQIGTGNVGVVLDSWHWHTAEETVDDLKTLSNQDVVACDLNDAPAGVPVDEQVDSRRELPATTGVIDIKGFLTALREIGYDGPVRAEPFSRTLNAMEDDRAVAATGEAMRRAFAMAEG